MANPDDSLRLLLISLNELKQVAVLAAPDRFGLQLFSIGVIKGKEQLETFLEMAEVDHYIVSFGEPFSSTFKSAAFAHNAKEIVDALEKSFESADELRRRVDKGEPLSEEERTALRFLPRTWTVWSSSIESSEGIDRVRGWFKANKA